MAWSHEFPSADLVGERAEQALRLPFGVSSPLWAMYGAAAGMGVAYWWMTSWARAVNFEALTPFAAKLASAPESLPVETPAAIAPPPVVEALAPESEPVIEVVVPVVEALALQSEPVLEPVIEVVVPVVEQALDDLTVMTGIGPKLSAALAARGVSRFSQIAAWTAEDLAKIDTELSLKGRAVREAWVAQAKRLAASH